MADEIPCRYHPERKALSFCHHCGERYCFECLTEGKEFYYCKNPDCQKALELERNPPPAPVVEKIGPVVVEEPPEEVLVLLAGFLNVPEGRIAQLKLEAENVESFMTDYYLNPLDPQDDSFVGEVQLLVRESELEKATQILQK